MLCGIVGHRVPRPRSQRACGSGAEERRTEAEAPSDDEVPEAHRPDRRGRARAAGGHHRRRCDGRGGSGHPPRPRHSASARAARRAARPPHPASHATNPIATAARYLGIAPARLRAQLRSGESLAQVAEATPGRSLSGLTAAVLAAREARLGTQLASGRLTEAQRQKQASTLSQRVDEQLSRPGPATANTSLTWAARYLGAQPAPAARGRALGRVPGRGRRSGAQVHQRADRGDRRRRTSPPGRAPRQRQHQPGAGAEPARGPHPAGHARGSEDARGAALSRSRAVRVASYTEPR